MIDMGILIGIILGASAAFIINHFLDRWLDSRPVQRYKLWKAIKKMQQHLATHPEDRDDWIKEFGELYVKGVK